MWTFHIYDYFPLSLISLLCNPAQLDPTHKQNVFLRNTENIQMVRKKYEVFCLVGFFCEPVKWNVYFPL